MSGYAERAKLRDFLHVVHGGFTNCRDPTKFIEKLAKHIEKAKNLRIRIDYDATVKRIALTLCAVGSSIIGSPRVPGYPAALVTCLMIRMGFYF